MYVATIIPIARGIPFDTLTYYASQAMPAGTLVSIPFNRQVIVGIVLETTSLTESKTMIKQANFSLKKIKQVLGYIPYFAQSSEAIQLTATQSLAPVGAVAGTVIPQFLFDYISSEKISDLMKEPAVHNSSFEESVQVGTEHTRTDYYKRLIRSAFAAKKSVLFVVPTIRALEKWKTELEKGIAKHVIIIHSKTTKKNLRSAFSLIKSSDRPLIIFVTTGYFLVPRIDIGHIIAENESSNLYKSADRYGIDARLFIRHFCERGNLSLCWGDTVPRFETLERLRMTHLPRTFIPDKLTVVPIDTYRTVLPTEVIEIIRHAQKKKRRIYIYTNRKGVAPLSRCADCTTIVSCENCTLPMILRNKIMPDNSRERYFVCTHCAATLSATHVCSYCGSWNISPVAIGTESITDEVKSLVGEDAVITIDDEVTPDSIVVTKLIAELQSKKFAVVVGTVKALPYLKGIHYTVFPFFDRLLSTPSLYTTEVALRLILECNERSSDGVILCTRHPEFPFLRQLAMQKINGIIHDELTLRKELGYPPFGLILKISLTVPESYRQYVKESVEAYFFETEITMLPARRISLGSMKVLMTWVLKVSNDYIIDEGDAVMTFLDTLRFPYRIEQNPERL